MDFPPTWPIKPLGELVEVLDSQRIPVSARERADRPGAVPYYGAAGQIGWIDAFLFDEPLILLGEDGVQFLDPTRQKSYLIDGPSWVNNHAHVLRPRRGVERRFLNYYLNSADYRGLANGTTRLKLTQAAMRRMPVPVPDMHEQRRIVDLLDDHLSRLDAAHELLRRNHIRAVSVQEAWLRHALADAPEHGHWHKVGEVLESVRGGWSRSARHLVEPKIGVPYLKMNNITRRGRLDLSEVVYVEADDEALKKYGVRPGDVLFNSKNSGDLIGKTAVADLQVAGSVINENIMRLRFDGRVIPEFAALWFLGPAMRSRIISAASASTNVAAVYQKELVSFPIWVPEPRDQSRLVAQFGNIREAAERMQRQGDAAHSRSAVLRRAILASAFAGGLTNRRSGRAAAEEAIGA